MSAYLAENLPHLQSLHAQLALPATALASDEARIETAVRHAVSTLMSEREAEVDNWKDGIAAVKKEVAALARAVGDKGRNVLAAGRRESLELEVGDVWFGLTVAVADAACKVCQAKGGAPGGEYASPDQESRQA
jgi:hypothetical protein